MPYRVGSGVKTTEATDSHFLLARIPILNGKSLRGIHSQARFSTLIGPAIPRYDDGRLVYELWILVTAVFLHPSRVDVQVSCLGSRCSRTAKLRLFAAQRTVPQVQSRAIICCRPLS